MSRQFAPRTAPIAAPLMPPSHGAHSSPISAPAPVSHSTSAHHEEDGPERSQRVMLFAEIDNNKWVVKPKTKNPDRQKQNFPIRYVDSKANGRNLQEINISVLLGHPDQTNVNQIISPAKAYQRDPSLPPENPHALSIGIKFSDPEIVEWIANFNNALLDQLKSRQVTAVDPVRPDIPVEELDNLYKSPFVAQDDGSYVGYFFFTDDSLRNKATSGRPSKMPVFEILPYGYDKEADEIVLFSEEQRAITYYEINPQEDYCMVVFTLGAMRLDSMSMGNKGTRYPFIGSKLYLDKLILLKNKEIESVAEESSLTNLLSKRMRVRDNGEDAKRARQE